MMKRITLITLTLFLALTSAAQDLPQFAYNNYEGWIYNNPGVELNNLTIGRAQIRLYVDSQGLVLSLTSPQFSCQGLDSIQAEVRWRSESTAVALTMALDDINGTPLDSATCLPSNSSSEQTFIYTLPIPHGQDSARVRLVSWNAVAATSGAVRQISLTGITSQAHEVILGDVDDDGAVNISDVTALIDYLLKGTSDVNLDAADIDHDGKISISDVTELINMLLHHSPH